MKICLTGRNTYNAFGYASSGNFCWFFGTQTFHASSSESKNCYHALLSKPKVQRKLSAFTIGASYHIWDWWTNTPPAQNGSLGPHQEFGLVLWLYGCE